MASDPAVLPAKKSTNNMNKSFDKKTFIATQRAYNAVMMRSFMEKYAYDLILLPNGHWAVRSRNYVRHALCPRPPSEEFVSLKAPELQRWISYLPPGVDFWYSPMYDSTKTKTYFVSDPADPEYGLIDFFGICEHRGRGTRLIINMIRA